MKKALVLLTAAAAIAVPATLASASNADISLIYVSSTGSCKTGYTEVAQAGSSTVCVRQVNPGSYRVTMTGCTTGETAYLVLNQYGVCTTP